MSNERDLTVPTFAELIEYLAVLSDGYVKPDLAKTDRVESGVVRDTKKYFDYIEPLNAEMCKRAGITLPTGIDRKDITNRDY